MAIIAKIWIFLEIIFPHLVSAYSHLRSEISAMKSIDSKPAEIPSKSHRGAYVEYVMRNSRLNGQRVTKTFVAEKLGTHRRTLDLWFSKVDMEVAKIRDIGRVIRHDFSEDFPELKQELSWTISDEIAVDQGMDSSEQLRRCKTERDRYRDLYIQQLEKFTKLQEEFYTLKLSQTK